MSEHRVQRGDRDLQLIERGLARRQALKLQAGYMITCTQRRGGCARPT